MLTSSFRLSRVAGVKVGVHVSWFVVFGLITWSLADHDDPTAAADLRAEEARLLGAVSAILLFASVLVRELARMQPPPTLLPRTENNRASWRALPVAAVACGPATAG